jgi:unspecific monooxygenase
MPADLALERPKAAHAGDHERLRAAVARDALTPPAPKPATRILPLWALISALQRNALATWGNPAYELDIVERPFLGRQSFLLNEPAAIRHVLVEAAERYGRTPATSRLLHPMIGDGLFLAEGEDWRRQRRLVAPAFAPRALDIVAREAFSCTAEAIRRLERQPTVAVDLLGLVQRLTLEVAGRTLFSQAMTAHAAAIREMIGRYGREHARPHALDFFLPSGWPNPHDWPRRRFARQWQALLDRIIAERAQTPPADPPRDLFDALVTARDAEGRPLAKAQLRDQIATLLIAGHETTALALFWSLHLLALAPATQDLVAEEAGELLQEAPPASRVMAALPITRAVVQEALRLYPPAFSIVRMALEADELQGHAVAPGALMVISPWVLHRHRKRWDRPPAFDPTRFMPEAPPVDRYAYLPFGVGPRVCVGAQFALVEATLVLSRLVGTFRLEPVDRRPLLPVGVVTTVPERVPAFRLTRR